jgi:hypothetical protein
VKGLHGWHVRIIEDTIETTNLWNRVSASRTSVLAHDAMI